MSDHLERAPRPGEKRYPPLRRAALEFLISARWIQGEARERHIRVTRAQVLREYRKDTRANFKTHAEFKHFLHSAGETVDDILFRVRIDTLSSRLLRIDDPNLVPGFSDKWRPRTTCATGYVIADYCGG